MRHDGPLLALVDAYATGRFLQQAFAGLGADVVHVSSTPEPLRSMRAPDLSTYRASLVCTDPAVTARELAAMNPVAVVAGQEPGVPLADTLSEMLGLPTNGSALSAARRDKYVMIETVRKAGLTCAEQFKSDEAEPVVAWARQLGRWPVVVKPLAASGSQGVAVCADAEQVRQAAEAVLGTTTMYGQTNTEVLVQSYLDGTEYIVDTVSCAGQRYTSAVWRYEKRRHRGRNLYHRDVLVDPAEPVVDELTRYVDGVLDALGIDYGPSHAEVMLTADGPALVEVGARMNGTMNPEFDAGCCGADLAAVSALAYCQPRRFRTEFAGRTYAKVRDAFLYEVATELDGTLARIDEDVLAEIRAVPSVGAAVLRVRPGDRIRPTVDLPSSPLSVHMSHESLNDLVRDYDRVTELAKSLYHLENTEQKAIISS